MDGSKINETSPKAALENRYLAYLSAINSKDWDAVATFAQPTLTHNGKTYSNTEYAKMIDVTSAPFKGVQFVAERLVVDADKGEISCRIRFDWDKEPFHEHVFYQLRDGKILNVWSVVNLPKDN